MRLDGRDDVFNRQPPTGACVMHMLAQTTLGKIRAELVVIVVLNPQNTEPGSIPNQPTCQKSFRPFPPVLVFSKRVDCGDDIGAYIVTCWHNSLRGKGTKQNSLAATLPC